MDKRSLLFVFVLSLTLLGVNILFEQYNLKQKEEWLSKQTNSLNQDILTKKNSFSSGSITSSHSESENTHLQEKFNEKLAQEEKVSEKFYVIETPYQQLVFSNYGGALAEINLPFKSEENHLSVVREIDFDRKIVNDHPYNAKFPQHAYYQSNADGEILFESEGKLGGYYPLLRRDLIQTSPYKTQRIEPKFYALNLISDLYSEVAQTLYKVVSFDQRSITFKAELSNRTITKTFSIIESEEKVPYCLHLNLEIEGDSKGLWLTSGVPEVEWISGAPAPALKYRITRNQKSEVEKIDLPKNVSTVTSANIDWICNSNGFLGMILNPLNNLEPGYRVEYVSGNAAPSRLIEIDEQYEKFKAIDLPGYVTLVPISGNRSNHKSQYSFFAGPFDGNTLKHIDRQFAEKITGENPDYVACQTMHGWFTFISEPFSKILLVLMNFFYFLTHSWALSIILLTISLRVMLYPLNTWSTKSMAKMQEIAPLVTAIQEKHKKDPKKAQIEIMDLYREKGVNPVSGCLPLLIQMPFLIGMFDLLKSSFALRGAPFIPGWIDDLTAPDVLFSWSKPIFFFGTDFHLLPFLLGAVMFVQQRFMSNAPADVNQMTDQQRQQRTMGTIMTIAFTFMFYNFPSGLNIYWLCSMLLGIIQQWFTTKKLKNSTIVSEQKPVVKKNKAR